jgi:hypothetical protein
MSQLDDSYSYQSTKVIRNTFIFMANLLAAQSAKNSELQCEGYIIKTNNDCSIKDIRSDTDFCF